ncbi:hypothetical protein ACQEVG_31470 [Streptomyces sp. CA-135486]|uniref:hypothetical protein n=1 Tax=Streptomyces sp. CA-135486 TaxID=3240049 RepID=UPI003D92511E
MERFRRASVAGVATAAVLAGSVGVAVAVVSPTPARTSATGRQDSARPDPVRPELTATATVSGVRAWEQFRVYGAARHLSPGTTVALQQKQGNTWVTLPASMELTRRSTYKMRVHLGLKGQNQLRIVGGGTRSPVFQVAIR